MMTIASHYLDGHLHVVVVTGHATAAVKIGVGDTIKEAWESMQSTPMQSVGRDSGEAAALGWAHGDGWVSPIEELEYLGCIER